MRLPLPGKPNLPKKSRASLPWKHSLKPQPLLRRQPSQVTMKRLNPLEWAEACLGM
jgi:hypothetical protein